MLHYQHRLCGFMPSLVSKRCDRWLFSFIYIDFHFRLVVYLLAVNGSQNSMIYDCMADDQPSRAATSQLVLGTLQVSLEFFLLSMSCCYSASNPNSPCRVNVLLPRIVATPHF